MGAFAKLEPEFTKRGVKLIGLSANTIDSHGGWIKDIDEISGSNLRFPIIGDKERKVAYAYDMLDHQDITNVDQKGIAFTIRSVFIIDPKKTIRLILSYPASTGRNTAEVLRVVDSLQTGDKNKVTTPINWVPGKQAIPRMLQHGTSATDRRCRRRRHRASKRQNGAGEGTIPSSEDRQALPSVYSLTKGADKRGRLKRGSGGIVAGGKLTWGAGGY